MSFQGLQAKYNRLHGESAAWKLLRADNAPYILAFIADLFSEESELPFGVLPRQMPAKQHSAFAEPLMNELPARPRPI